MKIKGFFSASVNIFIIAVVLAHSICAQKNTGKAQTPNKTTAKTAIEGVWNISFDSPAVHFTAAVEFVRRGAGVIGYLLNQNGVGIEFSEGQFERNTLQIKAVADFNRAQIPITISAEPVGDSLSGKWTALFIGEGNLTGRRIKRQSSPASRLAVFDAVWKTVEDKYYSTDYDGVDWKQEREAVRGKVVAARSQGEMAYLIGKMLGKLTGSHIAFYPNLSVADSAEAGGEPIEEAVKNVEWRKLNASAGYIKIKDFSDETGQSGKLIAQAFEELNDLPALVIDLRDNAGGGLDVAEPLGSHLFQSKQCVGYFYTRTAAARMKTDSLEELERQNFPVYADAILPKHSNASKLVLNGAGNKAYKGKVALLINEKDYSTTEAFAQAFKESGRGIIVGTKTAGKMLASDSFSIGKTWMLQLPIADYRSCAGTRVEGRGVSPDIEVEGGDAAGDAVLTKALILLSKP